MAGYRVSHTSRVVACKECKGKLVRGELRVDKVTKQGAHHAKCVFDSFVAGRMQDGDIQGPGDLLGWDALAADDQETLQGQIIQYLHRKNRSNNDGSPSTSNVNTIPASPLPATFLPSTSLPITSVPTTSTPAVIRQGTRKRHPQPPPIAISDSESDPPTPPQKLFHPSHPPHPVLPNLLDGVTIPPGPPRTYDECSVCLDDPVHPVALPCSHVFCYLCAKGLTRQAGHLATCSLCRKDIPDGYLKSAQVLAKASLELNDTPPLLGDEDEEWQWFYQGRNGWWRFEERNNEELEENFSLGRQIFETMICGNLYVIDFQAMEQFQKGYPNRKRKIKRDSRSSYCKGVAGLQKRKWMTSN